MLQAIRHTFFKIRIFLGAIRAGIKGIAVVFAAWIFLAPPSMGEAQRLALPPDATAQHEILRAHRVSKILMMIDSDRIYDLVAEYSDDGLTAADVRLSVIIAADGRALAATPTSTETEAGAKFVAARTN